MDHKHTCLLTYNVNILPMCPKKQVLASVYIYMLQGTLAVMQDLGRRCVLRWDNNNSTNKKHITLLCIYIYLGTRAASRQKLCRAPWKACRCSSWGTFRHYKQLHQHSVPLQNRCCQIWKLCKSPDTKGGSSTAHTAMQSPCESKLLSRPTRNAWIITVKVRDLHGGRNSTAGLGLPTSLNNLPLAANMRLSCSTC